MKVFFRKFFDKYGTIIKIFAAALAGGLLFALFCLYSLFIVKTVNGNAYNMIDQLIVQNVSAIENSVNNSKSIIKGNAAAISSLIGSDGSVNNAQTQAFIAALAQNSKYPCRFIISDKSGDSIGSDGTAGNLSSSEAFSSALSGKITILGMNASATPSDSDVTMLSAPIYKGAEIVGVLSQIYSAKEYNKSIAASKLAVSSLLCILDKDGELVRIPEKMTLEQFEEENPIEEKNFEKIKKEIAAGKSGTITQSVAFDMIDYIYYSPISVGDNYGLVFFISNGIIASTVASTYGVVFTVSGIVMLGIVLFALAFIIIKNRNHKLLEHSAYYDELTDLPNEKMLERFFLRLSKKGAGYVYLHIRLNNFSQILQTFGYDASNNILRTLGVVLTEGLSKNEIAARLPNSSFAVMIKYTDEDTFRNYVDELVDKLAKLEVTDGKTIFLYSCLFSIGILKIDGSDISDINDLKAKGRLAQITAFENDMVTAEYDENMQEDTKQKSLLLKDADKVFAEGKIIPYIQPRYEITGHTVISAEIFSRWKEDAETIISPKVFLPVMEVSGNIQMLDIYMVEKACGLINKWLNSENMPVPLSINVSRINLYELNFVDNIIKKMEECNTPPSLIDLQFSQKDLLRNEKKALSVLTEFHEKGFVLSIDDFGNDVVPLEVLYKMPIDIINISNTFLNYAMGNEDIEKIFDMVVATANQLNILVSASMIETEEQKEFAANHKCNLIQGRLICEAKEEEEFEKIIF